MPRSVFPESEAEAGELHLWAWGDPSPQALVFYLQRMFQCPYFFFDVVYIHNGTEEKEEEASWKVRAAGRCGWQVGGRESSGREPWSPGPAGSWPSVIQQLFATSAVSWW